MSYSTDLGEKVIAYLGYGHSQRQAKDTFHVSLSAVNGKPDTDPSFLDSMEDMIP